MGFLLEVDDEGTCWCVLWLILGHGGSGGVVVLLKFYGFFFFWRWLVNVMMVVLADSVGLF